MTLTLLHTSCSGVTEMAEGEELKGLSLVTTTELDELDTRDTCLQSLPHTTAVNRSTFSLPDSYRIVGYFPLMELTNMHNTFCVYPTEQLYHLPYASHTSGAQTESLQIELDHFLQNLLVDSIGAAYQYRSCSWEYWIKQAQHNLEY